MLQDTPIQQFQIRLQLFIIIYFLQHTMFLARLFTYNWQLFSRINYNYSQQHLQNNQQLTKKIAQSATWNDFTRVYQQHKHEFHPQTFQISRAKIQELLHNQKEVVSFKFLSEVTKNIIKIDINALDEKQIISLASILRSFQTKGLNPQVFHNFKIQLLERYSALQLNDPQSTNNINKMMQAYELFNFFKWYAGCKPIMERLFKLVNPDKPNLHRLTKEESFIVLRCLSQKQDLNITQKKVRSYLLQSICQRLNQLQKIEVVAWVSEIMKMDGFDYSPHDIKFINILLQQVTKYGNNLEYQQALKLVTAQSQQLYNFLKMYDQICDYIFQKISTDGTTSSRQFELLNLLKKISCKFKFQRLSETNKEKFFKFLQLYAKQLQTSKDVELCQHFFEAIKEFVKNSFIFYDNQKTYKIIESMLIEGVPVSSSILFVLQTQKIDIGPFIQNLLRTPLRHKLDAQTLQHIILVDRIYSNDKYQKYRSLVQTHRHKLSKLLAKTFNDNQLFTNTLATIYQTFPHSEVVFGQFHRNHPHLFNSLVNPFEVEESKTSNLYKLVYSQFVMFAFYTSDMVSFFHKYQSKIKHWIFAKLINRHYSQKQARLNLLAFCLSQLQVLNQHKNRDVLEEIIFVVGKYHRFVLQGRIHKNVEELIYKLANSLFKNIEIIQQLNLQHYFLYTMEKYFTVNHKNYHNEINYRQLLTNALQVLDKFKSYKPTYLIKEALRLNTLTKEMIRNVDVNKLGLNINQKHMVSYLVNPNYLPKIDVINYKMLNVILHNPKLSEFINKNVKQIVKQINKCHSDQLFQLITIFNQPRAPHTRQVMLAMLQKLAARQEAIQKGNFVGALDNLIKINYYFFAASRQVIQKVVTQIQPKLSQYSLWTHERVINFIITQNGYKTQHYFQKLVQHYQSNENYHIFLHLLYILSKTSYFFKRQQCKQIKPLIEHNLQRGLSLFFAMQALVESQQMKGQILASIVQQIKAKSASLSKLQYDYLKKKYVQQIKQLNLSTNQLEEDAFSLKPQSQTIEFLELLAKQHDVKLQMMTEWGSSNYIVKIKNWVFSFFHPKRQSSIHEHNFIKRALNLYFQNTNKGIVSIQLGVSKTSSLLSFLKDNHPQLINQTIFNSLNLKISKQQGGKRKA